MNKYSKLIKLLLLILVVVAIIVGFNQMKVKNIEVVGGEHYTAEEITEKLLNGIGDRYTGVIWAKNFLGLERNTIPFVEKTEIEIIDKNSIRITVYDKAVIGCVRHMEKNMFFDREGIVVEITDSEMDMVPVITGVNFTSVVMNQKLEVENDSIFKKIMEITQLLIKYDIKADEINFDIRNNITIYVNGSIALMGESDNYDYKVNGLKNVLDAAGTNKYKFDFRKYSPEKTNVSGIPLD